MNTQGWATDAERRAVEAVPMAERWTTPSVYAMLCETVAAHPSARALSFQITAKPKDRAETLDWSGLHGRVTAMANLLRSLGIREGETVAILLPNCSETPAALLAGMTAGIACPINPLLEVEQIAAILRETRARVLITLAPFLRTDVAQKAHAAAMFAPELKTVLTVDLNRYLRAPMSWAAALMRPRVEIGHGAAVLALEDALAGVRDEALDFAESADANRICAYFHTGGTTGSPKLAQHRQRGAVYNGKIPSMHVIGADDVVICPLPMFHVLGAYPILMSCVASGAELVLPTPAGYRGDGVMDNFWALIKRYRVTFMVMVPTAATALLQRPVRHDLSSLKFALCGSAPLPVELFRRFEETCGVRILEGYGMTEATCLVSINPPEGERKIGSVGLPIPYTEVRILDCEVDGEVRRDCGVDEIGEICLASPGVFPGYSDEGRNFGLFTEPGGWLRTGDLGRLDADGYLWITGRAKDLIIRGGHNIDPGLIEEALMGHHAVAFCGAIGQPDAVAGELPCVYVELREGAGADEAELMEYARAHTPERAAVPKHLEILPELPKTAVGKVFKPALRKRAITRVLGESLAEAGIEARVAVVEDPRQGLVAEITSTEPDAALSGVLDRFAVPWRRAG